MPRPKKETAGEPKKRSRTGCWPCKARKVKCGVRTDARCNYTHILAPSMGTDGACR
jgi:hypothetical protein